MNTGTPEFVWKHHDAVGRTIGEIRRFVDDHGRKKDIPFYNLDGGKFKSRIPESLKQKGYTLFGIETYCDKESMLII